MTEDGGLPVWKLETEVAGVRVTGSTAGMDGGRGTITWTSAQERREGDAQVEDDCLGGSGWQEIESSRSVRVFSGELRVSLPVLVGAGGSAAAGPRAHLPSPAWSPAAAKQALLESIPEADAPLLGALLAALVLLAALRLAAALLPAHEWDTTTVPAMRQTESARFRRIELVGLVERRRRGTAWLQIRHLLEAGMLTLLFVLLTQTCVNLGGVQSGQAAAQGREVSAASTSIAQQVEASAAAGSCR